MANNDVTVAPGDVVVGRYRVDALLGRGGFGVVFRATQVPMGRPVALKMLLADALELAGGRARFRREAELAQRLSHPNTVRLYDFGETDQGLPFIVWELLEGRPLDAVLAAEGRLAPSRVARIAVQTLKALMEAHALGIVHRDIKPSNVFLCEFSGESDFVKVLDFGIAKNTRTRGTGLTEDGSVVGTPAYMAPEQVLGSTVSPVTDVYALGLMMAEMLTGKAVYPGAVPMEVMLAQIAEGPVPLPPEVLAAPFGAVIARAVEKSAASRFASAGEMLQHLEAATETAVAPAPKPAAAEPSPTSLAGAPTAYVAIPPPTNQTAAFAATAYVPVMPEIQPARPAATVIGLAMPPAPAPRIPIPPALPEKRSTTRRLVIAAVAGAVVTAAAIGAALRVGQNGGVIDRGRSEPFRIGGPHAPVKRFAHLTTKQLKDRIEKAGHKIVGTTDGEQATTFVLSGNQCYVQIVRTNDVNRGDLNEQLYLKETGATARDGNTILYVHLYPQVTASRALLDQIAH